VLTYIFIFVIGITVGLIIGKKSKKVSSVNFWDRALSAEEIALLYKADKIISESYSQKV